MCFAKNKCPTDVSTENRQLRAENRRQQITEQHVHSLLSCYLKLYLLHYLLAIGTGNSRSDNDHHHTLTHIIKIDKQTTTYYKHHNKNMK